MTKHSEIATEGRHVAYNNSFADEATRLAHSYAVADIGKWYKQEDTGEYWELETIAPTFTKVPQSSAVFSLIVCNDNEVVCYDNEVVYYE
jgi:hypothetical protein